MNQAPKLQLNESLIRPISCSALFSPEECDKIRHLPYSQVYAGRIENDSEDQAVVAPDVRNTTCHIVEALPENRWISARVFDLMKEVNQEYYHFRLNFLSQLQVLEYQVEGRYTQHLDIGPGMSSSRKLSIVVYLSSPAEYTGGRLLIEPHYHDLPQELGTAVVFPSYLLHQVEPVSSGERWTMVAWAHGPAFC
ncbi:MAG: 2OG-Fe(II) oxygenase [Candidatus Sericytochromatia bacterium]